jgi:regulator of chromosome condensation
MASGCDHLLLLDISGQVYSLGCAESGQLGRLSSHFCQKGGRRGADKVLAAATIQLKKVTRKTGRVIDVACGQYSSFLVTESGQVIGFGLNNCYQMGYHDREVRYAPEVIPIKENGENVKIKKIASGMHHTLFLSESGDVYTVGCGDYGRLGVGQKDELRESKKVLKVTLPKPAINVGCGSCTSYAILDDSTAMAWGMGSNLQLTNGSEDDEWEPIKMAGK